MVENTIQISYVGYTPIELNVNNVLNLVMHEDEATLDEVIVTATLLSASRFNWCGFCC